MAIRTSEHEHRERLICPNNVHPSSPTFSQSLSTFSQSILQLRDTEGEPVRTQVIIEVPPQYDCITIRFPPGFDHPKEESPENIATVERALSRGNINDAGGFNLKFNGFSCCPSLTIFPLLGTSSEIPDEEWKFAGEPSETSPYHGDVRCCCCFPPVPFRRKDTQTITFMYNNEKLLYFTYIPKILSCGGKRKPVVEMYVPEYSEKFAFIIRGKTFQEPMLVNDCMSNTIFFIKSIKIESEGQDLGKNVAVVITDQIGSPIAIARSIAGCYGADGGTKWEEFEMKFNPGFPPDIVLSATTKAVIMIAFATWAIAYREDYVRTNLKHYLVIFLIALSLIILQIAIKVILL